MPNQTSNAQLITDGRRLARNTVWNLIGSSVPLVAGFIITPFIVRELGTERYGALALTVAAIGYFGLFDLGLGRALSKLVAEQIGKNAEHDIPALVGTALAAMGVLGLVGSIVAALATSFLVHDLLKTPPELTTEVKSAFYLLAATIPILTTAVGARAVFEAYQRFGLLNAIRVPLSLAFSVIPLVILLFTNNLAAVVVGLVFSRCVDWAIHMFLCFRFLRTTHGQPTMRRKFLGSLLSFGGWMTVTNIVGPVMVYFDRFLIGAVISLQAVAYYAIPYSVVTHLLIIPAALLSVLFPALSTLLVSDQKRATRLMEIGINAILLSLAPATLIIVPLAAPLLDLWIGPDFAANSSGVAQWLAVGVLVNSTARVPYAFIQAQGRPDLTAKLHVLEFIPYLIAVWALTSAYGAVGAAIGWTTRIFVDTILLFIISGRLLPEIRGIAKRLAVPLGVILAACALGSQLDEISSQIAMAVFSIVCFMPAAWYLIMGPSERALLTGLITVKVRAHAD